MKNLPIFVESVLTGVAGHLRSHIKDNSLAKYYQLCNYGNIIDYFLRLFDVINRFLNIDYSMRIAFVREYSNRSEFINTVKFY